MDTNTGKVAQQMVEALMASDVTLDVDGAGDAEEMSPGVYQFTMNKWHDRQASGDGGFEPLGQVIYTVTVTAAYKKFDE